MAATTEKRFNGVDDDGFPGSCFAGKGDETAVEAEFEAVDDGKIEDAEFLQHRFLGLRRQAGARFMIGSIIA